LFDEFQTSIRSELRRPKVDNLYDVFINVRDDEGEHVKTMVACQQPQELFPFVSPHSRVLESENTEVALMVAKVIEG
jgi:ubiquinol oxidase